MHARAVTSILFLALAALAIAGCDKTADTPATTADKPAIPTSPDSSASAPPATPDPAESAKPDPQWTAPEDPKQTRFLGMVADKPVTWIEHPGATEMEQLRMTVPGRDGTPAAEIVVFYFGQMQGGTVEANIQRWQSQFRPNEDGSPIEPEISTFKAGDDMDVTLVEILGDWRKRGAAAYTDNQLFLSAIVDSSAGMIFIRFVGDEATVGPNRAAFIEMVKSLREEE